MIRTAFLGAPRPAAPSLETLAELTDLQMVITRPDRPRGRGRTPAPSAVKAKALELGAPVAQPSDPQQLEAALAPLSLDLAVTAVYGMILPPGVLALPRRGAVNLHFSLLPRWRGAAPVQRAVLAGDPVTGVTLMQMEEGLDSGGVLAAWPTSIGTDETAGELTDRLAAAAAELLGRNLEALAAGELAPEPQDESLAVWAPKVTAAEARLDFTRPAAEAVRAVRAFCPRPGAHTVWRGARFKIHRARAAPGALAPARLEARSGRVLAGAGGGCVELLEVQPAGARSMTAAEWLRGVRGGLGSFE